MSQGIFDTIVASSTSGTQLATILNDLKNAIVTGFSGDSRPSNLQAGGYWIKDTNAPIYQMYFYDGTSDILLLNIDSTAGTVSISTAADTISVLKKSNDDLGATLELIKSRISGGGQTLVDDELGAVIFKGTRDDAVETIQAKIRTVSQNNVTSSVAGSYLVFEAIALNSTSLNEVMRIIDGSVGIGVEAPDAALHVKRSNSTNNFVVETEYDGAQGADIIAKKKRIAGNGQAIDGDYLLNLESRGATDTGAETISASIKVVATQDHTAAAHGAKIEISTVDVDAASPSLKMTIGDEVDVPGTMNVGSLNVTNLVASQTELGTITETEDPSIVLNKNGTQAGADAAVGGFEVEMSDATNVKVGYDSTTTSKIVAGEVGNLKEVIVADLAQEVANKSIVTPSRSDVKQDTYDNLYTYAATATNGQFCYATDQKKYYQITDGALKAIGSGAGGILPTKNYLENYRDLNNWTRFASSSVGNRPVDFDGVPSADTVWDIELNDTTPLRPDLGASIRLNKKTATDIQGEGAYLDIGSLDKADLTSVLKIVGQISCSANYADGYVGAFIAHSSDSWSTYTIVDATPTDFVAGDGNFQPKEFQSNYNSADEYRLLLFFTTSETDVYTIDLEMGLGLTTTVSGAIITDWVEFTPTGGWVSNTSYEGKYRRVGDSAEIVVTALVSGVPTATPLSINLPNGLAIDTNKLNTQNITYGGLLGVGQVWDSSGAAWRAQVGYATSTSVYVGTSNGQSDTRLNIISESSPFTWASGDSVTVTFMVPIAGWSSSQVLSENDDGRKVAVQAAGNGGGAFTANVTDIDFTEVSDSHSAWNGTQFNPPVTDDYLVEGQVIATTSVISGLFAYIDGVQGKTIGFEGGNSPLVQFNRVLRLEKGKLFSIRADASGTLSNDVQKHTLSITRIGGGSQQIAASEMTSVFVTSSSGQAIPNITDTTIIFNNIIDDTHGRYNASTGEYTCARSGKLNLKSHINLASGGLTGLMLLNVTINGSVAVRGDIVNVSSAELTASVGLEGYPVNHGDVIKIVAFQNTGAQTLNTEAARNYLGLTIN